MGKTIKVILFVLLAIVLSGIKSQVSVDEMGRERYAATIFKVGQEQIDMAEGYPYSLVAELVNNAQTYQTSMSRVQRAQIGEYFFLLKSVLQSWADRESALSQHWERIHPSTASCYYCHPVSEYYVFTLRRIII